MNHEAFLLGNPPHRIRFLIQKNKQQCSFNHANLVRASFILFV